MFPEFPYIFKSSVLLTVFLGYYYFFLRKETFFTLNRLYLAGTLLLSVCIPFLHIPLSPAEIPGQNNATPVYYLSAMMEEISGWENRPQPLSLKDFLCTHFWWIYLAGVGIFSFRFLWQTFRIFRLVYTNPCKRIGNIRIIFLDRPYFSFSFFNFLFLSDSPVSREDKHKIFEHEKIHICQLHSVDLLLSEIISIFVWYNPLVWLYKPLIAQNHEYIADHQVIRKYQTGSYFQLLINQAFQGYFLPFTNHFACSNLKKRMRMMTQKKTKKYGFFSYLPAVLLGGILCAGFTCIAEQAPAYSPSGHSFLVKMPAPDSNPGDSVYTLVDQMPQFNGDIHKWAKEHINYPEEAINAKAEGKVYVKFIVEKDGNLSHIEIVRSSGNKALDEEALRATQMMPPWIPGEKEGEKVRVVFINPINFFLPPADTMQKSNKVYVITEERPVFEGNLSVWIKQNLKYPSEAKARKQQGKVYVKFTILKDGSVSEPVIQKSSGYTLLDEEALRVVKTMPQWTPAKQGGLPVNVAMVVPVNFGGNS